MGKGKKDGPVGSEPPDEGDGADHPRSEFPIQEHIGRTLKALFDDVTAQPVPEKLTELLRELERKRRKE